MTYTPTDWQTGDIITAEKMNKMESGIANAGVFYITATWDDNANGYVLDKTAAQIEAAYANGQLCVITGGINATASVAVIPLGTFIDIEPAIQIDVANNLLTLITYRLDPQTEIVSGTEYFYTLTPAS